jgi:aminoglycoside phosphotransferase (APT) family kinase protein
MSTRRPAAEADSWDAVLPEMFAAAGIALDGPLAVEPLTGGVSSDIVKVTLADGRQFCAKRALNKLKVATNWEAPLERNHYEVAWLRRAASIVPKAVPAVIAEDEAHGIALLEYLPPEEYSLWKADLLAGQANDKVAVAVATALGRIHAGTLKDEAVAAEFPTDHLIDALRLDPYLRFTAGRHPLLSQRILDVLEITANTKLALVHGDVSPKNILVSLRDGHPVLLDAECAWYGDPAFDAAFCLNHLLLKAVHLPALRPRLLAQARAFSKAWLKHFRAKLKRGMDERTAGLLPCLMLARVDGKSPVEYLNQESKATVRRVSTPLIQNPESSIDAVIESISRGLGISS